MSSVKSPSPVQHYPEQAMQNNQIGILLMILTSFIFAIQDGISQYMSREYNVAMIVMIRYWFFALFVIVLSSRTKGGIRRVIASRTPWLQILRSSLLALEICVMLVSFVFLGLIESHAIFAIYPIIVALLSAPILGEKLGWRRWTAIFVGLIGVIVILNPGAKVFSIYSVLPLVASTMFALYHIMTRKVARVDKAQTSFFYTGIVGCIIMTVIGIFFLEPIESKDWGWMFLLCLTGTLGHFTLIKTLEIAQASVVQPFAFFQIVFASMIGFSIFNEKLELSVVIGSSIVISAAIFTILRHNKKSKSTTSL